MWLLALVNIWGHYHHNQNGLGVGVLMFTELETVAQNLNSAPVEPTLELKS